MYLRLLVSAFLLPYVRSVNGDVNIQSIYNNLASICQYTPLCNNETSQTLWSSNISACCEACFCSADCKERNNCCPFYKPKERKVIDRIPAQKCILSFINPKRHVRYGYDLNVYGVPLFNAVTTCREDFRNDETRKKCEDNFSVESLQDGVLVSDSSDFVYKNRFCAECNAVSTSSTWLLKTSCSSLETVEKYHTTNEFLKDNGCMFWSVPPSNELKQNTRCHKGYDSCNQTGDWDIYDAEMEEACDAYSLAYFHSEHNQRFTKVYKNVHCFMCNNKRSVKPVDTCQLKSYNKYMDDYELSFTAIINLNALDIFHQPKSNTHHRNDCLLNELYDPIYKVCRELACPVHFEPVFGECVIKFLNSVYFPVAIFIKVRPNVQQAEDNDYPDAYVLYTEEDLTHLVHAVRNATKLEMNECGYCSLTVGLNANGTLTYMVMVVYHTTLGCNIDMLIKMVDEFQNIVSGNITLEANNKNVSFIPNVSFEFNNAEEMFEAGYRKRFYHAHKYSCSAYMALKETLNCPKIELNETEYERLTTNTEFDGPVSKIVSQRNNSGTVSLGFNVCVDDYMLSLSSSTMSCYIFLLNDASLLFKYVLTLAYVVGLWWTHACGFN